MNGMNEQDRSIKDRRCGKDRRRFPTIKQFLMRAPENRVSDQRRVTEERRNGWVRLTKWSSIDLGKYKISKYLKPY
ncbi:MAG: hypothetical protein HY911_03950 [Desulfobacterales bacterium]|nr:hypothetical protein [Desulfobacterales bacterium]